MYKALRPFKVFQPENGSYREVKPGDDVPEAATWKKPGIWIRRRWITDEDGKVHDQRYSIIAKATKTKASVDKLPMKGNSAKAKKSSPPVPQMAPKEVKAPQPEAKPEKAKSEKKSEVDLVLMSKSELQELAESKGLDSSGSKADLVTVLMDSE